MTGKRKKSIQTCLWYFAVILVSITTVLPFIWTISTSLKTGSEILSGGMNFIPKTFTLDNYAEVFNKMPFLTYLKNSLIVSLGGVVTNLFFGSLAGYAFAKLQFRGKKIIYTIFLMTMMIPSIVTMIPNFMVLRGFPLAGGNDITGQGGLGLINTYWSILLPGAAGALAIFFMRQFYEQLPDSLYEAARIDGASEFQIFMKVYLPLTFAPMATLGIMTFQARWNQFMWPLIVMNSEKMKTVQVGLAAFKYDFTTDFGPLMAGTIVSMIPSILLFMFAQKYYVQGIADSGIK